MLLSGSRSGSGIAARRVMGGSLGVAVLLITNSASALQPPTPSGLPVQVAQSTTQGTTTSTEKNPTDKTGDVVVETEPQKPGADTAKPSSAPSSKLAGTRFSCQLTNGQYTVMYAPESQPGQSYPWANPGTMGGGWSPQRRCNEISRRLESYRPDGLLEMQTAVENGYNTICVTTQKVSSCRIVLTVPTGQDPVATRDRVFQNLTIADSGKQTEAVNTFAGSGQDPLFGQLGQVLNVKLPNLGSLSQTTSNGIDLRPFLDRADGGTAQYLRSGVSSRPAPRLNPNRFR